MFPPKIEPHQQVRSAPSQSFPPLANPALSLENWTANTTINMTLAAAAVVLGDSHVSLTTQPLMLDSGRFHQHHLALQTAVAARVSGEDKLVEIPFHKLGDGNAIWSGGEKCQRFSFSLNTPCHR